MKLHGIARLHRQMKQAGVKQQLFQYAVRNTRFAVLFTISGEPFEISLTTQNGNLFLLFEIKRGYVVEPKIANDKYRQLANLLRKDGSSGNRLIPAQFLQELDDHISLNVNLRNEPTPTQVAQVRHDLEEREKPFFWYWRNNEARDEKVSQQNFRKTLLLLGEEAGEYSLRHNVSSVWTSTERKAQDWRDIQL